MIASRPTVTAALITYNEEQNLRALLPRLSWADEIVVVDGGSTDGTRDVARWFGAKTLSRRFNDFAEQRNAAIALARGDWVLSIDADEYPSPAFVDVLRTAVEGEFAAFRIPIRSSIFGRVVRFGGVQDDCPIRLFRRGRGHWVGDVHEVLKAQGRVGRIQAPLQHVTTPDFESFLKKMSRYTQLSAAKLVAEGVQPQRGGPWAGAARELFRRFIWKQGYLDGPEGWAFCALSGFAEWVACDRHRRRWEEAQRRNELKLAVGRLAA